MIILIPSCLKWYVSPIQQFLSRLIPSTLFIPETSGFLPNEDSLQWRLKILFVCYDEECIHTNLEVWSHTMLCPRNGRWVDDTAQMRKQRGEQFTGSQWQKVVYLATYVSYQWLERFGKQGSLIEPNKNFGGSSSVVSYRCFYHFYRVVYNCFIPGNLVIVKLYSCYFPPHIGCPCIHL